jgi:hypothetical protein
MKTVLAIASILFLTGCIHRERFETSGGGHKISAVVEGGLTAESHATHAAISSPFGAVTIEPGRARIDQGPWQKIPENAFVQMRISKHTVSIRAGSVSMTRTVR